MAPLVLLAGMLATPAPAAVKGGFEKRKSPVNSGRLFDLGVTDYDRDGNQELFSTNHKFLGTLAESDGAGGWEDRMASTGFGPTPRYPGFENLLDRPTIDDPGLYIYAAARSGTDPEKNPVLHIVAKDVRQIPLGPQDAPLQPGGLLPDNEIVPEEARGRVTLLSPAVEIKRQDGAEIQVRREEDRTIVDFTVAEQGHIAFRIVKADVPPIKPDIDQAPLLARTFVGPDEVPGELPSFVLRLIDRHGVAWTDANLDGRLDAFIVRGGLGGAITDFVGKIEDELLIKRTTSDTFEDRYGDSGLSKGGCRSRLTASIDYDGDGLLDLFSSCKRATPELYRATGDGEFISARGLGGTRSGATYYRWIDLRGDRRPELVVFSKERAVVLKSKRSGRFKAIQRIRTRNGTKLVYSAAVGDFDRDGDPDIFVGANSGNTLLVNRRGRLKPRSPRKRGLPGRGSGASWVDFNNDGRPDLHSLPTGLYRQKPNGKFKATGKVGSKRKATTWGLVAWPDFDNDGHRDYATAVRRPGGAADLVARSGLNVRDKNNWLQVDLDGEPGNPQGVGARVRIKYGDGRQTAWVGEADSSRFSQGHYRAYFGLGKAGSVDRLTVRWPDGGRTRLNDVAVNQRLVVSPAG